MYTPDGSELLKNRGLVVTLAELPAFLTIFMALFLFYTPSCSIALLWSLYNVQVLYASKGHCFIGMHCIPYVSNMQTNDNS